VAGYHDASQHSHDFVRPRTVNKETSIMNNSITHYQTSFRVINTDGEAFKQLKRNVYGWIVEREKDHVLKDKANEFFFRCDWPNLFQTHSSLLSNTFLSESGEAWALHYTELDRTFGRKRFWYTDIGFKKEGTDVIVSVRNSYAWNAEDLSAHREEPQSTVPRIVRFLLQGNTVYSGRPEFRLIEEPAIFKTVGMGKVLAEFIQSPDRRYPLIVFNGDGRGHVDEARWLARDLTGKAQVAIMGTNKELAEEFQHYMPKDYRIQLGEFRVFFPFNNRRNSPDRHRWYDISHPDYADHRAGILHGLLRNHTLAEKGVVESVEDIGRLIGLDKLHKVKAENPEQQKILDEFFAEHAKVAEELDNAKSEAANYANQIDNLEKENGDLKFKIQGVQARLGEAQSEATVDMSKLLSKIPENLFDIAKLAARSLPRLVITEAAVDSAAEYANCQSFHEAWEMLLHLNDSMAHLKFEDHSPKDLEKAFKEKTGYDLAMNEGKVTQKDKKLMRLRTLIYNGKEYDITPHLKHQNNEPKSVRIYFAFDDDAKKIIVGHIGRHIPNATSKSM
jgi:hypothetical protein